MSKLASLSPSFSTAQSRPSEDPDAEGGGPHRLRPERREGVRSTCGGCADARRSMVIRRQLWRREFLGRSRECHEQEGLMSLFTPGMSPANREATGACSPRCARLPEPLWVSAWRDGPARERKERKGRAGLRDGKRRREKGSRPPVAELSHDAEP